MILAKTVLTELANFVASGMPGNYSASGGLRAEPLRPAARPAATTADGRPVVNTGGSSSGIGTAANFWAANVGTETSGSILSPSNQNMLAGIKPTVGRISRYGVIPITADQDTAGPMAKYGDRRGHPARRDGGRVARSERRGDQAPARRRPTATTRRSSSARRSRARASAFRARSTTTSSPPPGDKEPRGGLNEAQAKSMADAIAVLKEAGAEIVDPADIPSVVDHDPRTTS